MVNEFYNDVKVACFAPGSLHNSCKELHHSHMAPSTDTSMIIWTALPVDSGGAAHQVTWQLATDSTFAVGTTERLSGHTDANSVYVVKVDVSGSSPLQYFPSGVNTEKRQYKPIGGVGKPSRLF
jgi:hypothetical protein